MPKVDKDPSSKKAHKQTAFRQAISIDADNGTVQGETLLMADLQQF